MSNHLQPLSHGVHAVDTGFCRPGFDAAFLLVENGRAAFIDTGPNPGVPRLLGALDALGIAREAVDYVIPTHVHLDHAGGAGALMRELPRATLVVHHRGARHLIDPAALAAGARAIYGDEEFERSYGEIVPVDPARVLTTQEATTVSLAGRTLEFLDTPGHARHHHCVWDARSNGFFTGDTFGLSYREFDNANGAWVLPSSTPVQFEPEVLRGSVMRLLERRPERMFLTHFGAVTGIPRLGAIFLEQLDEMVALGERVRGHPERDAELRRGLRAMYLSQLRRHGCTLSDERITELLSVDIGLNAEGMGVWLDKAGRAEKKS